MQWKTLLPSKQPPSMKIRLMVLRMVLQEWFSYWWLLVLSLILLAIGLTLVLVFQLIGLESARWTLSALVQAGAALLGIFFVALSLLWHQATQEHQKLKGLMDDYIKTFGLNTAAVGDLLRTLSEISKGDVFQSAKDLREKVTDCFSRIVVLQHADSLYSGRAESLERLISQAPIEGLVLSEEAKKEIRRTALAISIDEVRFFKYLLDFDNKLSSLARELKLPDKGSYHLSEALHRARRVDQVGVSLYRIRFFKDLSGAGLKVVSFMWLLCLTIGLLVLVSLDSIPASLLPILVLTPIAIGVIAIGTTLSLGFRAMRSEG